MPYTIAFEVLKGRIQSAHKESAGGALKMIGDIKMTGMKVMSISSSHEVLIPELETIAEAVPTGPDDQVSAAAVKQQDFPVGQ